MPVIAGGLGAILDRRMPRVGWFIGAALALIGEAILITSRDSSGEATLQGDLLVILAATISAVGYVAGSRATAKIGAWSTTFWGVTIAGFAQVPILVWLMMGTDWTTVTYVGWLSTLYLVMFSTVLAYAAWYWALNHGTVVRIVPIQSLSAARQLGFRCGSVERGNHPTHYHFNRLNLGRHYHGQPCATCEASSDRRAQMTDDTLG